MFNATVDELLVDDVDELYGVAMAKTRAQHLARVLQKNTDLTYGRALSWVNDHHARTGHKFTSDDELLAAYAAELEHPADDQPTPHHGVRPDHWSK